MPRFLPNEVVITTSISAENDSIPSQFNVSAGLTESITTFGEASIDQVLGDLKFPPRSIARVFVPKADSVKDIGVDLVESFSTRMVTSDYDDMEKEAGLSRTYRINFEKEVEVEAICRKLVESFAVESAQPNYLAYASVEPNDPRFAQQWGCRVLKCPAGWDVETGHEEVIVAIVDSGVDLDHEDLAGKLLAGRNFVDYQGGPFNGWEPIGDYSGRDDNPDDDHGHGTHCAGIAATKSC